MSIVVIAVTFEVRTVIFALIRNYRQIISAVSALMK
jgi:hypothetical protein